MVGLCVGEPVGAGLTVGSELGDIDGAIDVCAFTSCFTRWPDGLSLCFPWSPSSWRLRAGSSLMIAPRSASRGGAPRPTADDASAGAKPPS